MRAYMSHLSCYDGYSRDVLTEYDKTSTLFLTCCGLNAAFKKKRKKEKRTRITDTDRLSVCQDLSCGLEVATGDHLCSSKSVVSLLRQPKPP